MQQEKAAKPCFVGQKAQENVLATDVFVFERASFLASVVKDASCAWCNGKLAWRYFDRPWSNESLRFADDLIQVDLQISENQRPHAAPFLDKTQQDVLRANVFVIQTQRL
jgi:hypothetical protein